MGLRIVGAKFKVQNSKFKTQRGIADLRGKGRRAKGKKAEGYLPTKPQRGERLIGKANNRNKAAGQRK